MSTAANNISGNLATIVCVVAAGCLASYGQVGWGWFLFAAVCMHCTYGVSKSGRKSESAPKPLTVRVESRGVDVDAHVEVKRHDNDQCPACGGLHVGGIPKTCGVIIKPK